MNEDIGGGREELPPEKVDVSCRLGFMDLEQYCKDNNFASYIVWYASYNNELSCQVNLGGRAWGDYGCQIQDRRIKCQGKTGTGLAGKAFQQREAVLLAEADRAAADAAEEEKAAAEIAKECGIASKWAIFRDGAVFEFATTEKMNELPHELIDKIGGSTGVAAAAKAVLAVVRLGALAKGNKKIETAAA